MTVAEHPRPVELAAFLRGELPPEREAQVRAHLAEACVPCLLARQRLIVEAHAENRATEGLALAGPSAEELFGLTARIARRAERLAWLEALEEKAGAALLAELQVRPRHEHRGLVQARARYHLLGLARWLARRCRAETGHHASEALHLGELAVEVAEALDLRVYLPGAVAEVRALAWCALGNAERVATDLPAAEAAFAAAARRLPRASSDEARLEYWSLLASLQIAQVRFEAARESLAKALELAVRLADSASEARVVLKLAKATGEAGDATAAVALLDQAEECLQRQPQEELGLFARQARACWLLEAGRPLEAQRALDAVEGPWLRRVTSPGDRLRMPWLRARVDWATGHRQAAERGLLAVREAFRQEDLHYDVALVALDLAVLYLEEGRTAEVRRLALEMHPVFRERELHQHAGAALELFQAAATAERATVTWVRQVARYLERARGNPYLRFEAPGP